MAQPSTALSRDERGGGTALSRVERESYSISEFCEANGISVPTYYKLKNAGRGPAEMRLGAAIQISAEARAAWRRARENPADNEAAEIERRADEMRRRSAAAVRKSIESDSHISSVRRRRRADAC